MRVWNRTPERAKKLEDSGARAFDDPAEAARGATRVHLSVSDDAAVDDILSKAKLPNDAVIVDHTTTSAKGVIERSMKWPGFVHAPVFMGPQNALESTGIMLVSGERTRVEPLKDALAAMTGKLVDLGDRPDAAAAYKLLGNSFLMFLTAGFADMLMLAKSLAIAPDDAAKLFDFFNPGATLRIRFQRMIAANFAEPSWELAMARKDARLMMEASDRLQALPAIAQWMDRAIAEGHGREDWTVIGKAAL